MGFNYRKRTMNSGPDHTVDTFVDIFFACVAFDWRISKAVDQREKRNYCMYSLCVSVGKSELFN